MTHSVDSSDPREWMRRARSNLARARQHPGDPAIVYEDLCFDAQQAAEKAIKAVLVSRQIDFPKTHAIASLLTLAAHQRIAVPEKVLESIGLTRYAVHTRYPSAEEPVTPQEHQQAVALADRVVRWAEALVGQ